MSVKSRKSAVVELDENTNVISAPENKVSIAGVASVKSRGSASPASEKTRASRVSQRSVQSAKSGQTERPVKSNKSAMSAKSVKSVKSVRSVHSQRPISHRTVSHRSGSLKAASHKSGSLKAASHKSGSLKAASHKSGSLKAASQKSGSHRATSHKSGSRAPTAAHPVGKSIVANVDEVAAPPVAVSVTRRSVSVGVEPVDPTSIPAVAGDDASLAMVDNAGDENQSHGTRCSNAISHKSRKSCKSSASRASASRTGSKIAGEGPVPPNDVKESEHYLANEAAIVNEGATVQDYTEFYEEDLSESGHTAGESGAVGLTKVSVPEQSVPSHEDIEGADEAEQSKLSNGAVAGANENGSKNGAIGELMSIPDNVIATGGPVNIVNLTARHVHPCSSMGSVRSASRTNETAKSSSKKSKKSCAARCAEICTNGTSGKVMGPSNSSTKSRKSKGESVSAGFRHPDNISFRKSSATVSRASERSMASIPKGRVVGRMQPRTSRSKTLSCGPAPKA